MSWPLRDRLRHRWAVPLVVVVLAAVLAGVRLAGGPTDGGRTSAAPSTTEPPPVRVSSDAVLHPTLEELVAESDLVIRATVTDTARGRVFGGPNGNDAADGGGAIESRLVTVEVVEVLAGEADADEGDGAPVAGLVVEEEGWLLDGAPLIVDGLGPVAEGDDVIWFLVAPTGQATGEGDRFVTVNAQGRYLVEGDRLVGADLDDALVDRIATLTPAELEAAVRAVA